MRRGAPSIASVHDWAEATPTVCLRRWTTPRRFCPRVDDDGQKKKWTSQSRPEPPQTQEHHYRELRRRWHSHLSPFEQANIEKTFLWAHESVSRVAALVSYVLSTPVAGQPEARFHRDLCVAWFRCLSIHCVALR